MKARPPECKTRHGGNAKKSTQMEAYFRKEAKDTIRELRKAIEKQKYLERLTKGAVKGFE